MLIDGQEYRVDVPYTISYMDRCAKGLIREGIKEVAIYPYGEIGRFAEYYLDEVYGIKTIYAIDAGKRGKGILTLKEAEAVIDEDIRILICSDHPDSYEDIRKSIYEHFDRSRVTDCFDRPHQVIERAPLETMPDKQQVLSMLKRVGLYENELVESGGKC